MPNTSTPNPWDAEPMFEVWEETKPYSVTVGGKEQTIEVSFSIAKAEALETESVTVNPGTKPHGQHAARNIGISIVREDRELLMVSPLTYRSEEQQRWWGCEVRFPSGCDDLFGVDHNKQMASRFSKVAKEFSDGSTRTTDALVNQAEDEELKQLSRILGDIRNTTGAMLRQVERMFSLRKSSINTRGTGVRPLDDRAAVIATEADRVALAQGDRDPTSTDQRREDLTDEERREGLARLMLDEGYTADTAGEKASRLVMDGSSFDFRPSRLAGSQMFSVNSDFGTLNISLNIWHPMYELLKVLEDSATERNDDELGRACMTLRLLFCSWASMEDQVQNENERRRIQNVALNWGLHADRMMSALRDYANPS